MNRRKRRKQRGLAFERGRFIIGAFHEHFIMKTIRLIPVFLIAAFTVSAGELNHPPKGFTALFNGKDITGWWGLKTEDPAKWMAMDKNAFADKKAKSIKDIH